MHQTTTVTTNTWVPTAASRGEAFPTAATAAPCTQRGLRCDQYARAITGVWYYQVDIEVRLVSSSSINGLLGTCEEEDVQYYSVRRRYNEFLQLYEKIKAELAEVSPLNTLDQLPPFPQKEFISSSMLGLLWRSSSMHVLEDRRGKFESLLRWIESHPALRESSAFTDFLGQPPQSSEGYVSLKEYSSQHWLSSLQQLTKEKVKRRRLSSDCSTCSAPQPERSRATKKRRQEDVSHAIMSPLIASPHSTAKRQKRFVEPKTCRGKSAASLSTKKRARARTQNAVAQVESNNIHKKKGSE